MERISRGDSGESPVLRVLRTLKHDPFRDLLPIIKIGDYPYGILRGVGGDTGPPIRDIDRLTDHQLLSGALGPLLARTMKHIRIGGGRNQASKVGILLIEGTELLLQPQNLVILRTLLLTSRVTAQTSPSSILLALRVMTILLL